MNVDGAPVDNKLLCEAIGLDLQIIIVRAENRAIVISGPDRVSIFCWPIR